MSKKDKIIDKISFWRSHYDKLLSSLLALCAFTFTSAGGVISSPQWLILVSAGAMILVVFALIFIFSKIRKLQDELGETK